MQRSIFARYFRNWNNANSYSWELIENDVDSLICFFPHVKKTQNDHARTRTWNPLIRSQMPYPLGHAANDEFFQDTMDKLDSFLMQAGNATDLLIPSNENL